MISLDYSVFYQVVLFVVLWVVLARVLFRPYMNLLEERERQTTGAQHDSTDLEREGARLRAEYEEKIAQAQAVGYAAKEALVLDGRQQREKIITQARDESANMLETVRQEVESELQKERQLMTAEVSTLAHEMASKILGRDVA